MEARTLIKITNLTIKHGGIPRLDNISLTVPPKTIFGILCQDRAQRITLMQALAGVSTVDDGEILICGNDVNTDRQKIQLNMSYMPENMPFYEDMTVIEYLSFIAETKRMEYGQAQKSIKDSLTSTNLLAVKDALISKLTPTGKARLGIAQAIISNPSVVLFDHPTYGLNENESQEIFKLIRTLTRSRCVIITSEDPQVFNFCDNGARLSDGRLDTNTQSYFGGTR